MSASPQIRLLVPAKRDGTVRLGFMGQQTARRTNWPALGLTLGVAAFVLVAGIVVQLGILFSALLALIWLFVSGLVVVIIAVTRR
jgi:predicted transcriptional regulator